MVGGSALRSVRRIMGLRGGRAPPPVRKRYSESESSRNLSKGTAGSYASQNQECRELLLQASSWYWVDDEWEFAGDGEPGFPDRLVTGSVPTEREAEAEAATSYLQDAFTRAVNPFSGSWDYEATPLSNSVQQSSDSLEGSTSLETKNTADDNAVDWIEPELHPCNCELVKQPGCDNVFDAFQLLQTNSPVQASLMQAMAISQASDIWDAMLKNGRVLEFRPSFQKVAAGNSKVQEIIGDSDEVSVVEPNGFVWSLKNVKLKLVGYMEKVTNFIAIILGFADKKMFAEKDGDILDRALKSFLMLSIIVLLIVVTKQAPTI